MRTLPPPRASRTAISAPGVLARCRWLVKLFTTRFRGNLRHEPQMFVVIGRAASPAGGGIPLGHAGEVRAGVEDGSHPPPRLLPLGRNVLGGPVPLVRAVALEHPAGHGGLVHLVDAV